MPSNIQELRAGEIGFITAGIKHVKEVRIGDTITSLKNRADKPLEGFKKVKQVVFVVFTQ